MKSWAASECAVVLLDEPAEAGSTIVIGTRLRFVAVLLARDGVATETSTGFLLHAREDETQ